MSQEYYTAIPSFDHATATIIAHVGTAAPGSREGDELVRERGRERRIVVVDDQHEVLDPGTVVSLDDSACVLEVVS